jgi:hypothetical protein
LFQLLFRAIVNKFFIRHLGGCGVKSAGTVIVEEEEQERENRLSLLSKVIRCKVMRFQSHFQKSH